MGSWAWCFLVCLPSRSKNEEYQKVSRASGISPHTRGHFIRAGAATLLSPFLSRSYLPPYDSRLLPRSPQLYKTQSVTKTSFIAELHAVCSVLKDTKLEIQHFKPQRTLNWKLDVRQWAETPGLERRAVQRKLPESRPLASSILSIRGKASWAGQEIPQFQTISNYLSSIGSLQRTAFSLVFWVVVKELREAKTTDYLRGTQ